MSPPQRQADETLKLRYRNAAGPTDVHRRARPEPSRVRSQSLSRRPSERDETEVGVGLERGPGFHALLLRFMPVDPNTEILLQLGQHRRVVRILRWV